MEDKKKLELKNFKLTETFLDSLEKVIITNRSERENFGIKYKKHLKKQISSNYGFENENRLFFYEKILLKSSYVIFNNIKNLNNKNLRKLSNTSASSNKSFNSKNSKNNTQRNSDNKKNIEKIIKKDYDIKNKDLNVCDIHNVIFQSLETLEFDDIALLINSEMRKISINSSINNSSDNNDKISSSTHSHTNSSFKKFLAGKKYISIIKNDMMRTSIPNRANILFNQIFRSEYLHNEKDLFNSNNTMINKYTNFINTNSCNTTDATNLTNITNTSDTKMPITTHSSNNINTKEIFLHFNSTINPIILTPQEEIIQQLKKEFMQLLENYSIAIIDILNYNYYQGYNEVLLNILLIVLNNEEFKHYYNNIGLYDKCSLTSFFDSKLTTIIFLTQRISEFFLKDYLSPNFSFNKIEELVLNVIEILICENEYVLSLDDIKAYLTEGVYFVYPWCLTLLTRLICDKLIMPMWDFLFVNHPLMVFVFVGVFILEKLNAFLFDENERVVRNVIKISARKDKKKKLKEIIEASDKNNNNIINKNTNELKDQIISNNEEIVNINAFNYIDSTDKDGNIDNKDNIDEINIEAKPINEININNNNTITNTNTNCKEKEDSFDNEDNLNENVFDFYLYMQEYQIVSEQEFKQLIDKCVVNKNTVIRKLKERIINCSRKKNKMTNKINDNNSNNNIEEQYLFYSINDPIREFCLDNDERSFKKSIKDFFKFFK